jgi:hypothetical protein
MKTMPQAPAEMPAEFPSRVAFLRYLSDFLAQFTRTAESHELHQVAYFLSMAALESADHLAKLQAESEFHISEGGVSAA